MTKRRVVISAGFCGLVGLAVAVFLFSLTSDTFLFFKDSRTYAAYSGQISTSYLQRYIASYISGYYISLSLCNLLLLIWIAKKYSYKLIWPLFNPYYLLLYFNYTKEQLFFFGLFLALYLTETARRKHWALLLPIGSIFTIRPIYLPLFLIIILRKFKGERQVITFGLIGTAVVIAVANQELGRYLSIFIDQIYASSKIQHVGRDFFPNLCVPEKASAFTLIPCWAASIVFLPVHEQVLSYNFIIYNVFLVGFWWIFYLTTTLKRPWSYLVPCLLLAINLVTFWWGPVLGAALRYSAPVYWFALCLVLYEKRLITSPRASQMRLLMSSR